MMNDPLFGFGYTKKLLSLSSSSTLNAASSIKRTLSRYTLSPSLPETGSSAFLINALVSKQASNTSPA